MNTKIKKVIFTLFLLMFFIVNVITVMAEEKPVRIVFALDCSNSMNYNDNKKMANEMMKLFADTCFRNVEIGLVFYNDSILQQYPLVSVSNKEKIEEIKNLVNNSTRKGSTDIGLALKQAVDMFGQEENQTCAIVLFSDGETDLSVTRTGRTMTDSKNDEKYALNKAKNMNCPIFSVGLNQSGNVEYLRQISEASNGTMHQLQSISDFPSVFQNIYKKTTGIEVNTIQQLSGSGKEDIEIALAKDFADDTTIIINHAKNIDGAVVDESGGNIEIKKETYYTVIHISEFSNNKAFLRFLSENNDSIVVNKIEDIKILPQIELPTNNSLLNVPINVKLYDKITNKSANKKFYENLKGELSITHSKSGQKERIALGNTGTMFTATYLNSNPGEIIFQAEITGENYNQITPIQTIIFSNTSPEFLKENGIPVLKGEKEITINLNDYFGDNDGDVLTYQLEEENNQYHFTIDKNLLKFFPKEEGSKTTTVYVSDGRGGVITSQIQFNIQSFLIYYKKMWIAIGLIFIALLILYFIIFKNGKRKPIIIMEDTSSNDVVFQGARFEGYFLKTLSGNEIPVLYWNASYINNKHSITLVELFRILDVEEKLSEARKIYFQAGKNGTVIFYHDTNCIVNIGSRDIPAGKREVLNFDDRLYIIFENNVTEIEIRYKRTRGKIPQI